MLQVHPVPVAAVGVSPVGSVSVTLTVVPLVGPEPAFVTISVKLPLDPRMSVEALAVFVMPRSGWPELTVVDFVPLLLELTASPPPLTVTVFETGDEAFPATFTVSVIAG